MILNIYILLQLMEKLDVRMVVAPYLSDEMPIDIW